MKASQPGSSENKVFFDVLFCDSTVWKMLCKKGGK